MRQYLEKSATSFLRALLHEDSERACPVVQSVSLFFWQDVLRCAQQLAFVPAPFVIALTGPSGSGKSFVRQILVDELSAVSSVSAFTQDNYYRDFEQDFPHLPLERFYDEIDFDDPAHIRFRQLRLDLARLRKLPLGETLKIPRLRYGTPVLKPAIIEEDIQVEATPFVITEGIHAFHDPAVLPFYDFKIYVDVDEKTRRQRWLERNQQENRGTTDNMWNTTVACLEQHILPARQVADLIVNNNAPREQVARFFADLIQGLAALQLEVRKEIA